MLAVSDTGIGMDRGDRGARSSSPSSPPRSAGKGTGLGLATVYGIVKQSGGTSGSTASPGAGTTFKVYLPRVDGAGRRRATAPAAPAAPRGGTETVLLVEDDESVRDARRARSCSASGYTVLEARHGGRGAGHRASDTTGRSTCCSPTWSCPG